MTDSRVAAADRKSFGQSFGLPRATLGRKATPLAEIVTRVSEGSGTANRYLDQATAVLPATSAIFYTPLKRELIGRLWRFRINRETEPATSDLVTDRNMPAREARCRIGVAQFTPTDTAVDCTVAPLVPVTVTV